MFKKFVGGVVALALVFSFVFVSHVKAQDISAVITGKSFDGENYIIKGHITLTNLNPEGQLPESDDVTVCVDVLGEDGKYPILPDTMYIRQPAGCETSYVKDKKCLSNEEYYGKNCKILNLWSWNVRHDAWQEGAGIDANGGFAYDASKVKDTYENDFTIKIPKSYADQTVRIRADLIHRWGGPFANWPAFSFHHTILYEGKLKGVVSTVSNGSSKEAMQKLQQIVINTMKSLKNKAKDKERESAGMHIFPESKTKTLTDKQNEEKKKTEQKIKEIIKKMQLKGITVKKIDGTEKVKAVVDGKVGFWDKAKYYTSKVAGKLSGNVPGVKYVSDKVEDWAFKKTGLDSVKKTQIDLGVDNLAAKIYNEFNRFDAAEKKLSSAKTFVSTVSNTLVKPFSYVINKLGLSAKHRTATAYEAEYKAFIKQVKEHNGNVSIVKRDAEDTGSLTNKWIFDPSAVAANGSKGTFKDISKRIDYYVKIAKERGDLSK